MTFELDRVLASLTATDHGPDLTGVPREFLGTITAVNAAPTGTDAPWPSVDVDVLGATIPGVQYLTGASHAIGETVLIRFVGTMPIVIGALANNAGAPPPPFAIALGDPNIESLAAHPSQGFLFGTIFQCTAGGSPTKFWTLCSAGANAQTFTPVIYDSSSTTPGAKVWQGTPFVIGANQAKGWVSTPVAAVTVTNGNYYLLGWHADTTGGDSTFGSLYFASQLTNANRYVASAIVSPFPAASSSDQVFAVFVE